MHEQQTQAYSHGLVDVHRELLALRTPIPCLRSQIEQKHVCVAHGVIVVCTLDIELGVVGN